MISASTATTSTPGPGEPSKPGTDDADNVNLGDGGTGGGGVSQAAKNEKTAELLHEATQLLKTLRVPQSNPCLKVMQIGGLEHAEANMVLIDSGATHGLRPARDQDEWEQGERTTVQLANGTTDAFRLKRGTKILLGNPEHAASWIVPMGALAELDFTMKWTGNQCQLQDDVGRQFHVQVKQGCPMVSLTDGQKLLQWLEGYQVHQWRKLAMIRTFMKNPEEVDPGKLDLEMAITIKLRRLFPDLPEEILGKLVPHLEAMKSENFGSMVPWNRHKRRRLKKARNVVLHVFSGDNPQWWERNLNTATMEVFCVDVLGGVKANLLEKNVYAFLLTVAASGKLRVLLGGPPCRTVSALRNQNDGGPGELRSEEWPYGFPDLPMADAEKVQNDSILFFRFLSLYVIAEDVRRPEDPKTDFILEQPRDPEEYRQPNEQSPRRYMSMFRTAEWKNFQQAYQFYTRWCLTKEHGS